MSKELEEYSGLPICISQGEGGWQIIASDIPHITAV